MIVDPIGSYRVRLTPLGSGPYHLLMSREFNINNTKHTNVLDGTIYVVEPKQFVIDSSTMTFISGSDFEPSLMMFAVVVAWIAIITVILLWRRSVHSPQSDA